jgi:triacylglycerol lipase
VSNPITDVVTNLLTILDPLAAKTPDGHPAQVAALWTMMAFARRDFETTLARPLSNIANPNIVATDLLDASEATAGTPDQRRAARQFVDAAQEDGLFTGEPSLITQFATLGIQVVGAVADFLGVDITRTFVPLISSDSPPWFTTLGLNVQRTEFEGMPVWTIKSQSPSDKTIVAVHGGAYIVQPMVLHWLNYASLARDSGATVVVPIYPIAPSGTAAAVVPAIADLLSDQVNRNGAANVSVYGDSAGGGLAMAAMQELVRRGTPTPSRMVLLSPWLDVTMTDPKLASVRDPILRIAGLREAGEEWAGALDPSDPRVSPINGSLAGLPHTTVYSGSLDLLSVDTLRLREKALAEGADFDFVLRRGLIHDWPIIPFPEAFGVQRRLMEDLLGPA